jgi:hypothetical protein
MNSGDPLFFWVSRTVRFFFSLCFFLDQSRIKCKYMDCLIVRTIKSHALIPNLMRNNK